MKETFLVILDDNTGFVGLSNVEVYQAASKEEALKRSREATERGGKRFAININECPDGWSYYT